jgi:hypothetical protein
MKLVNQVRTLGRRSLQVLLVLLLMMAWGNAQAGEADKTRYSLEIKGATLEEAILQLSRETGVGISIRRNKAEKRVAGKSYVNETLDQIIRDLLRHTNHILVWNYSQKKMTSVDIWLFPPGASGAGSGPAPGKGTVEEAKEKGKPVKGKKAEPEVRRASPPKPPAAPSALPPPLGKPPAIGKLPPPIQTGGAAPPRDEPEEMKGQEAPAEDHAAEEPGGAEDN